MKRKTIIGIAALWIGLPLVSNAADDAARARELSQEFSVSSSQLMDVHQKQNLSWDEIRSSLVISEHSGASLDEVVRLKKSGMSFEDISTRYNLRLSDIEKEHPRKDSRSGEFREAPAPKRVQKKASRLADEYEVSEDEVMRLRDRGLGWREIRHALFISERSGRPLNEIVGLKESGMDWDDIAARYNVQLKDETHRTKERRGEGGVFREAPASERERSMKNDTDIRTQNTEPSGRDRMQQEQRPGSGTY